MTERTVCKWLDGPISLDGAPLPFAPVSETLWRARTRVGTTPVDLDLVLWGDGAELAVHPTRPPLIMWSARREARYFDEVHELTARVAKSLVRRPPSQRVGALALQERKRTHASPRAA